MSDYYGPMPVDINPIRYTGDQLLGFSARYEVTECSSRCEDYVEIRAFDPIPDRVFGALLEGDRIVLPLQVAVQVAAVILRSNLSLAVGCCPEKGEPAALRKALDGILDLDGIDGDLDDDDDDFDDLDDGASPFFQRPRCLDCDCELEPDTPPESRDWQWYMVHDQVWADAGMDDLGGCLCIDCLEKRLGRPLSGADLIPDLPVNEPGYYDDTERLAQLKLEAAQLHNTPVD
jgi:hypothetical protein